MDTLNSSAALPPSSAPKDYICPICLGVQGIESADTMLKKRDLVFQDDLVSVFINSFFFVKNPGHAIIVPNQHFEGIYILPTEYGHRIFDVSQRVALAMKRVYDCDGITTRQNNEPAGDQHAFHYHLHIYPRYPDDGFNATTAADKRVGDPEERAEYAERLKQAL